MKSRSTRTSASSSRRDLKQSHSTRTKRKAVAIIPQSCSDSPAIANQMDGVFGTDKPTRLRPGKRLGALVIVDEVGADVFFRTYLDSLQFHGWPWAIFLKLRTSHAAPRAPAAVPNPPKSEICVYMIVKFGWNALRCVKSIQTEKGILFLLMEARDHADAGRNRISRHGSEAANPGRSCQACR